MVRINCGLLRVPTHGKIHLDMSRTGWRCEDKAYAAEPWPHLLPKRPVSKTVQSLLTLNVSIGSSSRHDNEGYPDINEFLRRKHTPATDGDALCYHCSSSDREEHAKAVDACSAWRLELRWNPYERTRILGTWLHAMLKDIYYRRIFGVGYRSRNPSMITEESRMRKTAR